MIQYDPKEVFTNDKLNLALSKSLKARTLMKVWAKAQLLSDKAYKDLHKEIKRTLINLDSLKGDKDGQNR